MVVPSEVFHNLDMFQYMIVKGVRIGNRCAFSGYADHLALVGMKLHQPSTFPVFR